MDARAIYTLFEIVRRFSGQLITASADASLRREKRSLRQPKRNVFLAAISYSFDLTSVSDLVAMLLQSGLLRSQTRRLIDGESPGLPPLGERPEWVSLALRETMPVMDPPPDEQPFDRDWSNYPFDDEAPRNHYARRDEGGDEATEQQKDRGGKEVWRAGIGQEVESGGTEALAWYLPLHVSP